jgi:hypothetical protein
MNMRNKHGIKVGQSEASFNQPVACCAACIELHDYVVVFYEHASSGATRSNIW